MALIFVRIEMHAATADKYTRLHAAMAAANYSRQINDGSATFNLPTAMYVTSTTWTVEQVRDEASKIADSVDPGSWVLAMDAPNWAGVLQVA